MMARKLAVLVLFLAIPAWADLTIASWNVRVFSTGSRNDVELRLIAERLEQFDLITLQEVRDEEVVERTIAVLAGRGHNYRLLVGPPVGRVVKERYAFLWRPDKVSLTSPGQTYDDSLDLFIREPFAASFIAGRFDFTLATIHVIFGGTVSERRREVYAIDYVYRWLQDADPDEQDVILLGDFNLPFDDSGWKSLWPLNLYPVLGPAVPTMISDSEVYDNFWLDPALVSEYTGRSGVDRFDETAFDGNDDAASLMVSDHRPIWASFRTDTDDDGMSEMTHIALKGWAEIKSK